MHEGGGGSVGGADGRRDKKGGGGGGGGGGGPTVFETPRFASVAKCLATVPVASAAMGAVAGLPASRFVASHFAVMVKSAVLLTAGPGHAARPRSFPAPSLLSP